MSLPNELPQNTEELKSQAKEAVRLVGDHLSERANYLRDTAADARYNTEDFIQTNPWQSVAIAAAAGLLIGIIIARK
jgi:ElaB/YqjD/DUF883 family membrane-anchored ribosome-binding protein